MSATVTHKKPNRLLRILTWIIIIELELICLTLMTGKVYSLSEEQAFSTAGESALVSIVSAMPAFSLSVEANAAPAIYEEEHRWKGPVLSKSRGTITGPSGKETYYNLNMSGVVNIMRRMGVEGEYWVRDDGVKMLGDYVMVASNLNLRPRGSLVETSLGTAMVCDTGGFASRNPTQIDVAVAW